MRGYQEHSRFVQWIVLIIKSLMELNKLDHESVVRTGNRPFLLYKTLRFFVVIPIFENYVSNYEGYRPRDALNAMDEHIFLVLMGVLDELDNPVKQALDVFVLRVLQEKSQILDSLLLKPVLAVVSCAVYDVLHLIFLKSFVILCHFLAWHIQPLNYLAALLFAFLSLPSAFFRTIGNPHALNKIAWLILNLLARLFFRCQVQGSKVQRLWEVQFQTHFFESYFFTGLLLLLHNLLILSSTLFLLKLRGRSLFINILYFSTLRFYFRQKALRFMT